MSLDVIDYSNTVFYKIYCNDATVVELYVGHTTNFVQRKYNHKRACINENTSNHHLKVYKCIRDNGGWDNWRMVIIGFRDCCDHYEARKIEQEYFETLHATLNSIEPLPKPKSRPITVPKEKLEKLVWYCDLCKTTCLTNKMLIAHEETNKHKRNNCEQKVMSIKAEKTTELFACENCDFKCSKKSNYNKHLSTVKHKMAINDNNKMPENAIIFKCECGKLYKFASGLSRHNKICNKSGDSKTSTSVIETINSNAFVVDLISQNKELINLIAFQNQENKVMRKTIINKVIENITQNTRIL